MRLLITFILLCAALLLPVKASAEVIYINVSFKAIANPADGLPAPYVTNHLINEFFRFGNLMLENYQRGYRLRNAELVPYVLIGGSNDPNDPSTWYPFRKDANGAWLEEEFRDLAYTQYPAMYQWNFSALNIYLTSGFGGGFCATCTGRLSDYIVNGSGFGPNYGLTAEEMFASHMLHEMGHYFGLNHTHGNALCNPHPVSGICITPAPGDDGLASTLPDIADDKCSCMGTIDDLAQLHYGLNYNQLNAAQEFEIDNVWYNLMSYHERFGFAVLTEEQRDVWADWANGFRAPFVSGRTLFVDGWLGCTLPSGSSTCSTGGPYATVASGVAAANPAGGDIVLIRTGAYNETGIYDATVTLRPSRGTAIVGAP